MCEVLAGAGCFVKRKLDKRVSATSFPIYHPFRERPQRQPTSANAICPSLGTGHFPSSQSRPAIRYVENPVAIMTVRQTGVFRTVCSRSSQNAVCFPTGLIAACLPYSRHSSSALAGVSPVARLTLWTIHPLARLRPEYCPANLQVAPPMQPRLLTLSDLDWSTPYLN